MNDPRIRVSPEKHEWVVKREEEKIIYVCVFRICQLISWMKEKVVEVGSGVNDFNNCVNFAVSTVSSPCFQKMVLPNIKLDDYMLIYGVPP